MYYTYLDSPIGSFFLAGDGESLSLTSFTTGSQHRKPEPHWIRDPAPLQDVTGQLQEYFSGQRTDFDLNLRIVGTPFQKDVWSLLRTIPYGETRTYGQIAKSLGRPNASRAVGAANVANVLPILIPCHRVVGAGGALTGFGGGLDTKRWLLRFEGAISNQSLLPTVGDAHRQHGLSS